MIWYIMPYIYIYHLNNPTVPWSLENWGSINNMSKLVSVQINDTANRSKSWNLKANLNFHKVNQTIQHKTKTQITKLNTVSLPENLSHPLLVSFSLYPKVSTVLTAVTTNLLCPFLTLYKRLPYSKQAFISGFFFFSVSFICLIFFPVVFSSSLFIAT